MPKPAPNSIAGKPVGPIGYGMMNLTFVIGLSHEEASKAMKAALDHGANFWNAATFYGPPNANSLQLLKYYFTKYPQDASKVVLSLKGAYDGATNTPQCTPREIRNSIEDALRILDGTKDIDLFEPARLDPNVPLEDFIPTFGQLIKEGKIGSYGLSEVSASTIRRAHAILPLSCIEVELSLFSRDVLEPGGVADVCRELGIPLVGYSPLDRGWLTGALKSLDDLPADDFRRYYPRFQPGAFEQNVKLAEAVEALAKRKGTGVTSAQVAIAWVRSQGALPIPGATKAPRVIENCAAVELTDDEVEELNKAVNSTKVAGHRYPEMFRGLLSQ